MTNPDNKNPDVNKGKDEQAPPESRPAPKPRAPRRRTVRADGPAPTPPPPRGRPSRAAGDASRASTAAEAPAPNPDPNPASDSDPDPAPGPAWPHAPIAWPKEEKFSQPWMKPWLEAAASSLSVKEACRAVEVGLAQFLLARQNDLAFDEAALIVDQITDLMIIEAVRLGSLDGDLRSVGMYIKLVRVPAFIPRFVSWSRPARKAPPRDETLPAHVYEAMIAAGLEAIDKTPSDEPPET